MAREHGSVTRVVGAVAVTFATLVVVSGVWLSLWWRPTAPGTARVDLSGAEQRSQDVQLLHQLSSWGLLAALAALAVLFCLDRRGAALRRALAGTAAVVLAVAGMVTGGMIAWNQLALWQVTTGSDLLGLRPAFDGTDVRFVVVGTDLVSIEHFRAVAVTHVLLLPLALLAAVWLAARAPRSRPPEQAEGTAAPVEHKSASAPDPA